MDGARHKVLNSFLQEVIDLSQFDDCAGPIRVPLNRYHAAIVDPESCLKHRDQNGATDWLPLAHLHEQSTPGEGGSPHSADSSVGAQEESLDKAETADVSADELDVALADLIHALADKLPATGHYLDIVWLATSRVKVLLPGSHVSLYGALQRLCSWHGGLLTLVLEGTDDGPHDNLNAWANHFQGRVVIRGEESALEAAGRDVAWRGEIVLADGKGQKSVHVPGFVLRPRLRGNSGIHLRSAGGPGVGVSPGVMPTKAHATRKIVTFSRQLEVGCTVRRADVPNIFLSSVTLSLQLLSGAGLPRSEDFLRWLSEAGRSSDAALIMRLACRTLTPGPGSACKARPINTKAWKERIKNSSGDLTVPDLHLRETQEFFYLLVHSHGSLSRDVIAQVMYSPRELSGEAHARLTEYQQSLSFDENQNAGITVDNLASLDARQVQALLETIKLAQAEAIKTLIEERRSEGREPAVTAAELQLLMGTVYSSVMAEVGAMATEADGDKGGEGDLHNGNIVSESDLSPSCWLERLALQNHEALERKIKRFKSGEMMLAGMPVPIPADNTITLTADEFLKHFQANGLPSAEDLSPVAMATADSLGGAPSRNSCPSLPWSELKAASFKDAQKYTCPGILYCLDSGRGQQIDSHFSKMQQRYIRYETSSTCSSEQAASPATLTLPQPSPATADPAADAASAKASEGPHRVDRPGAWGQRAAGRAPRSAAKGQALVAKAQRSAEKRRRAVLERGYKVSPGKSLGRGLKRKGNDELPASQEKKRVVPTRTSPRKRVAGSGKPDQPPASSSSPKEASAASNSKPRKLSNSERTRLKLRQVVKETVISRGITKDNVCYKACMERLYRMTELYVKDLTSSRGLNEEMKNIAEANADFVVQFEQNRLKNS